MVSFGNGPRPLQGSPGGGGMVQGVLGGSEAACQGGQRWGGTCLVRCAGCTSGRRPGTGLISFGSRRHNPGTPYASAVREA